MGQGDRNQKYRGSSSQGGFEDRRGATGGYEERRGGGDRHNNSRGGESLKFIEINVSCNFKDRGGGGFSGFEVRRSVGTGFEDRRGSQSHRPDSNHQDRDFRKSEQVTW